MRVPYLMLLCLCCLIPACSDELDPAYRVEKLRLLAVQADSPFARPGSSVALEALAVDPAARPLTWAWGTCIDEQSSLAIDCLRKASFAGLRIGADLTQHTVQVPETSAPYLGVAVVVCPGAIVPGETNGIPLSCVDERGAPLPLADFEIGLKRISLRDPALNQNPSISEITWDGAPWPEGETRLAVCRKSDGGRCAEFAEVGLGVQAPSAAESSVDEEGAPIREQAVVQLYVSAGELEDGARVYDAAEDRWQPRPEDAGARVSFWFVVRDNRGGVSWTSRNAEVALQ